MRRRLRRRLVGPRRCLLLLLVALVISAALLFYAFHGLPDPAAALRHGGHGGVHRLPASAAPRVVATAVATAAAGPVGPIPRPPRLSVAEATAAPAVLRAWVKIAAARAANYLVRAIQPDGRFCYEIDAARVAADGALPEFLSGAALGGGGGGGGGSLLNMARSTRSPCRMHGYNLLRHAGALYALDMLERAYPGSTPSAGPAAALGWLVRPDVLSAPPHRPELLAAWSHHGRKAKLGGSALTLVAVTSFLLEGGLAPTGLAAATLRRTTRKTLAALGDFLLACQRPHGGFQSTWIRGEGLHPHRQGDFVSLYYPGEAALALVRLFETTGRRRYWHGAVNALLYLSRLRQGHAPEQVEADSWALIATAHVLARADEAVAARADAEEEEEEEEDEGRRGANPLLPELLEEADRLLIVSHATLIVRGVMSRASGASIFAQRGHVARVATRLEGLLAMLPYLRGPETQSLREAVWGAAVDFVQQVVEDQIGLVGSRGVPAAMPAEGAQGIKAAAIAAAAAAGLPLPAATLDATGGWTESHRFGGELMLRSSGGASRAGQTKLRGGHSPATVVRVDYVQHMLSALVSFDQLLDSDRAGEWVPHQAPHQA